jgi:hypothetical protein
MFSLKMTPVSMWGIPNFSLTLAPWVPLPLPLGPKNSIFTFPSPYIKNYSSAPSGFGVISIHAKYLKMKKMSRPRKIVTSQ